MTSAEDVAWTVVCSTVCGVPPSRVVRVVGAGGRPAQVRAFRSRSQGPSPHPLGAMDRWMWSSAHCEVARRAGCGRRDHRGRCLQSVGHAEKQSHYADQHSGRGARKGTLTASHPVMVVLDRQMACCVRDSSADRQARSALHIGTCPAIPGRRAARRAEALRAFAETAGERTDGDGSAGRRSTEPGRPSGIRQLGTRRRCGGRAQ